MGNACGGVEQACCSNDMNVDVNLQVSAKKDTRKGNDAYVLNSAVLYI